MKTKFIVTAAVLFCAATTASRAQDVNANANPPNVANPPAAGELYRASELSLEGYGFGTVSEYTIDHLSGRRVHRDSRLGLGAGLEYFFTRYVGIEAEGFSESTHRSFVDDIGGNLVLRFPIGQGGLAPYIFGGGGHQFDPVSGTYGDGGAGLEYRFTPQIGIFGDARFVATDHVGNYGMGRLGFRFSF